jgi:hypothetical protein
MNEICSLTEALIVSRSVRSDCCSVTYQIFIWSVFTQRKMIQDDSVTNSLDKVFSKGSRHPATLEILCCVWR